MIPDGWTETTLAEIADVIDCKHRTPSYADAGIPLISPGNISWGKLDRLSRLYGEDRVKCSGDERHRLGNP
jgi:type I restriction enzyme S subunit